MKRTLTLTLTVIIVSFQCIHGQDALNLFAIQQATPELRSISPTSVEFSLIKENLKTLIDQDNASLLFPFLGKNDTLILSRKTILNENLPITLKSGRKVIPANVASFQGRLKSNPKSRVTLTVDANQMRAQLMTNNTVYTIGRQKDQLEKHVFYNAAHVSENFEFKCGVSNPTSNLKIKAQKQLKSNNLIGCVEIYVEVDHDLYLVNNSSIPDVQFVAQSLFNEVNAIFSLDNINIGISELVIWDVQDPYDEVNSLVILNQFSAQVGTAFNGDLAHLIASDAGNGGIAFASPGNFGHKFTGYSDIGPATSIVPFPTTSFQTYVVAHELGHNFGSPHTHACFWTNSNVQVDDCGTQFFVTNGVDDDQDGMIDELDAGEIGEGFDCFDPNNPIIPPGGGTIMSYCHLNPVNIDISLGFGPLPGTLIQNGLSTAINNNVIDGSCIGPINCANARELNQCGTYVATPPNNGNGASQAGATHASWYQFIPSFTGTINISSCNEGVDTRLWVYGGTCGSLNLLASSDNDCSTSNGGAALAAQVLNLSVTAGVPIFIEWDDRWSTSGFDFTISGCPLPNYTCNSSIDITACGTYIAIGPDQGTGGSTPGLNANWFRFIPSFTGSIDIYSCLQGVDTNLKIHGGTCTNLTLIAANDDACPTSNNGPSYASEILNLNVTQNVPIYIEWDNTWEPFGFNFNIDGCPAPNCPPNFSGPNMLVGTVNTVSDFETDGILQSTQIVNANVDYDSGTFIELLQGFEVKLNKVFHAFIDGCGSLFTSQEAATDK